MGHDPKPYPNPYRKDRDLVRQIHREAGLPFIELLEDVPIAVCEARDPKGLYKKSRAALAEDKGMGFTVVDGAYEPPLSPEIVIHNDQTTPQEAATQVIRHLECQGMLITLK